MGHPSAILPSADAHGDADEAAYSDNDADRQDGHDDADAGRDALALVDADVDLGANGGQLEHGDCDGNADID